MERPSAHKLIRFSLWTLLSAVGVWLLCLKPALVLKYTPSLPINIEYQSIDSVLPIYPKTLLEAYDYGVLAARLSELANDTDGRRIAKGAILKNASAIAGRLVTSAELNDLRSTLVEMAMNVSVIQKVLGFFSFINILWLMAIVGISISILPAMWALAEPLLDFFNNLAAKIKEIITLLFIKVVIPSAKWLHSNYILEALVFIASFCLTTQGVRMQPESGMYVTISGLVALNACPVYSYLLHGEGIEEWVQRNKDLLACIVLCAHTFPMALHFQSVLLAYLATATFWHCLGFSILIYPFAYCIGWKDEDVMLRCASTSAVLLQLYAAAKIMRILPPSLGCFESPVAVLGSVMLFLCLLIMSNLHYPGNRAHAEGSYYIRRNCIFLTCALTAIYVGNVFSMNGLSNTATTFLVLWMLGKYCELHFELKLNIWILILLMSGIMYKTALWLHANPAFVTSLFVGFD